MNKICPNQVDLCNISLGRISIANQYIFPWPVEWNFVFSLTVEYVRVQYFEEYGK